MKSNKKNELDINKTIALDACIGSTNLALERSDKTIIDSKFYTQETRLEKKVLDDLNFPYFSQADNLIIRFNHKALLFFCRFVSFLQTRSLLYRSTSNFLA